MSESRCRQDILDDIETTKFFIKFKLKQVLGLVNDLSGYFTELKQLDRLK